MAVTLERRRVAHRPRVCSGCGQIWYVDRGRCSRVGATPRKCQAREAMELRGACRWCVEVPGECGSTPGRCEAEGRAEEAERRRG